MTPCCVVGFNHGVLGLAANTAQGTGCWRQNTEADRPRCFDARSQARGLCLQPSPARPWLKPIISRSHLLYSHVSQRKSSRWTTFPSRNPPFSFACFWLFPSAPPEINFTKILPVWSCAGVLHLISQQLHHFVLFASDTFTCNENNAIQVLITDNTTEDVQVFYNIFTTLMSKLSYTDHDKLISKFTFSSKFKVPAQQTHDAITYHVIIASKRRCNIVSTW